MIDQTTADDLADGPTETAAGIMAYGSWLWGGQRTVLVSQPSKPLFLQGFFIACLPVIIAKNASGLQVDFR